jgi:hypothetical protein
MQSMTPSIREITHVRPMAPLSSGPAPTQTVSWDFDDQSKILFPKGRDGRSMRVVLLVRELRKSTGGGTPTVFRVVRNAGKWSFKIQYQMSSKPTVMKAERFFAELERMGGKTYSQMLTMPIA